MNLVKVMPKCHVDYEMGDDWTEGQKSYSSFNIVYQLQDMQLDAERSEFHPLEVRAGMGINLRPAASKDSQLSFLSDYLVTNPRARKNRFHKSRSYIEIRC
jgi:hypothetical protein